jgi:hypothetical protein
MPDGEERGKRVRQAGLWMSWVRRRVNAYVINCPILYVQMYVPKCQTR